MLFRISSSCRKLPFKTTVVKCHSEFQMQKQIVQIQKFRKTNFQTMVMGWPSESSYADTRHYTFTTNAHPICWEIYLIIVSQLWWNDNFRSPFTETTHLLLVLKILQWPKNSCSNLDRKKSILAAVHIILIKLCNT